jgi:NAD(P)-dependent dehydrogenase (short-subunit alcohol dehydrogenase family)
MTSTFPTERTAVVTGAGGERGMGRHVARALAADGWSLALFDVQPAVVDFAAELAAETGATTLGAVVDITDKASVDAGFARIDAQLPPVLAEVNLAGIPSPAGFFEITGELFDQVMAVNAKGTLFMMQAAGERMIAHGLGGRIVNTASVTALDGGGTFSKAGYASAKAAVQGLTRGGARELGPHGITCNVLLPGPFDTDIMGGTLTDERKDGMSARVPVGRVGAPHEIGAIVKFLVSQDAGYVNGASISIDGGLHMH